MKCRILDTRKCADYLAHDFRHPIFVKPNPVFMKRRVRKIANFFAFNLLFFALYLNFIHKDKKPMVNDIDQVATQQNAAAFGGTVLVNNPDQYTQKKRTAVTNIEAPQKSTEESNTAALKLSIN
jgi:hypothetical protein